MTQAKRPITTGTELRRGSPDPLGATWDGRGVNFALFSEAATAVELCLFDNPRGPETARLRLRERTAHVFHGYVPGLGPGQLYGYRVQGPNPAGRPPRFAPDRVLIDPYARALAGDVDHGARHVPKGVVLDDRFDWGDDAPPRTPLRDSLIYEVHVKGFTRAHPEVAPELRGTYAGLASEPAIAHLRALGVTAVELLPVHTKADTAAIAARGLTNYWGYDPIAYLAPDARFSSSGDRGGQVQDFKSMVKALHAAGIEVLVNVVLNHTCEGDELGATLSLRGIDDAAYYRRRPDQPDRYLDTTGCGNTLNVSHPATLRLVLDSLRHWVTELHVDGFRFDLATTLARNPLAYDRRSPFLMAVHQDPVLSRVKLIAEPWDLGPNSYQVGNFPAPWAEWNGRYRDGVRRFWTYREDHLRDLGYRLTGSSDLYDDDGRLPEASVNFVTSHDGFTLHDLCTYERKRNDANGESNRDGENHNESWNCGVEGETGDAQVIALRERQKRNLLATLLLSQGVPMLTAGDELGRTQRGNNNAYCQDNAISWLDWELDARRLELLAFTRGLAAIRRAHPALRRRRFFRGVPVGPSGQKDLSWLRDDGREMTGEDWGKPARTLALLVAGDGIGDEDADGRPITDHTLLILLNGEREARRFRLPSVLADPGWELLVDTREATLPMGGPHVASSAELELEALSLVLLRSRRVKTQ